VPSTAGEEVAPLLQSAASLLGRPSIDLEELRGVGARLLEIENHVGLLPRVMGAFSLINLVWLLSILGIAVSIGPSIVHALRPLREQLLRTARWLFNHVIEPVAVRCHCWGVFEAAAWLGTACVLLDAARVFHSDSGMYVAATSAALALGYNLLALFIATIASMCGPGMALRGPEGSVGLAVRHMEQQLKRSLRFFGRGVIAIVMTLATVGLRNFQDIGFLGGIITLFIGIWAMHAIWSYGTEIAEKFYVSPDRAVRGTFVYGPNGSNPIWTHTAEERAELENRRKKRPRIANMWKARWRPDGHGISTPLWRLDKMIAFPYHDEDRLRNSEGTSNPDRRAQGERQQMANLVLNAQGPIASVRMRGESTSDGGGFDPIGLATYVHDAVMGTVGAENDSPKGRNRRQSKDGDRLLARNKKGAVELTSRR